jgi:hypothetical protein
VSGQGVTSLVLCMRMPEISIVGAPPLGTSL